MKYEVVIFIVESNGLLTVNVIYTERLLNIFNQLLIQN